MKGIILAGGSGTRLYPATKVLCKQLFPVYDKPMIYYPLSVLMMAGIREVLIISTPQDTPRFEKLFGDGSWLGMRFTYKVQEKPDGLAQAFILGEDFIGTDPVALALGDNIFFGEGLYKTLHHAREQTEKEGRASVFGYEVSDPERYGVIEIDNEGQVTKIEEKPIQPKSNLAVTGLYFYPNEVVEIAKSLTPSARGELEITDINNQLIAENKLSVEMLGRGFAWWDVGTHESFTEASMFIGSLEKQQGLKIACIEEVAWHMEFITDEDLKTLAESYGKSAYSDYLKKLLTQSAKAQLSKYKSKRTK